MTPDEQIAAIRERHAKYGYGFDPKYDKADIAALLARIDMLTAERDEAEANIGEVNQLLADTLSRTKSAEQRAEDAARVEREAVVKYANERADAIDKSEAITQREQQMQYVQSRSIRILAKAIARGEHNQDAAARQE